MAQPKLPSFLPNALRGLADTLATMTKSGDAVVTSDKSEQPTAEGKAIGGEASAEGDAEAEAEHMAFNDVIVILLGGV